MIADRQILAECFTLIHTLAENTKVLINAWELNMLLCESANLSWEAELCREGN